MRRRPGESTSWIEIEFIALMEVRNDQSEIVGASYPILRSARWIVNKVSGTADSKYAGGIE